METIIKLTSTSHGILALGRQLENNVRSILFDCSALVEEFGEGEATLAHQRFDDVAPYPVTIAGDGNVYTWNITDADTAYCGMGRAEVRWITSDGLGKSVTFMTQVLPSLTGDSVIPEPLQSWYDNLIQYINDHSITGEELTQAISQLSADISELDDRVTALEEGGAGGGLTEDIKQALLQIAEKVAYVDAHGRDYYNDLHDALYAIAAITIDAQSIMLTGIGSTQQLTATTTPPGGAVTWTSSDTSIATVSNAGLVTSVGYGSCTITASSGSVSATCAVAVSQVTLTSISADYQQSGTVYDTASLDSLKSDLTVIATYSDSSTATVTEYTLSGTLTAGTSTITVSYGGKTTTFNVTVTAVPTLTSISAVYAQGSTVYDTDTLESLKGDLVVTAVYSDSSTQTVPAADYVLSGSLVVGTSTITVTYGGKTTTFNVTVTHATTQYSITNTLTHVTNSNNATVINEQASYSATLSANSGYVITSVSITMGGTDITSTAYNSSTKTISIASVTGNIVITATGAESAYQIYDTIMANSPYTYNADNSIFFPDYVTLGDVASVDELQLEFEMQLQKTPPATSAIIGAKSSNLSSDINGLQFNLSANGLGLYAHGVNVGSAYGDFSSVLDFGRHIVKYENTNVSPAIYKCDNESKTISWTTNGGCVARLGLSFCNGNGTSTQTASNNLVKIGYVKIWDKDGTLLNHFVPAVRKSDNFVGMYDETNDVFITANTNTRYACGTWT